MTIRGRAETPETYCEQHRTQPSRDRRAKASQVIPSVDASRRQRSLRAEETTARRAEKARKAHYEPTTGLESRCEAAMLHRKARFQHAGEGDQLSEVGLFCIVLY